MSIESIQNSLKRIAVKINTLTGSLSSIQRERHELEAKIEDAQNRIQYILKRLPEQEDSRQMNLLGETAGAKIDDDHDSTTH
jgi:septal ring factor EnvC (AmiA/AmiB activator)